MPEILWSVEQLSTGEFRPVAPNKRGKGRVVCYCVTEEQAKRLCRTFEEDSEVRRFPLRGRGVAR